jgi:hypothetical protein
VVPAGEPEHLAHVADPGQAGARGFDRCGQLPGGVAQLGIEAADLGGELGGELAASPEPHQGETSPGPAVAQEHASESLGNGLRNDGRGDAEI